MEEFEQEKPLFVLEDSYNYNLSEYDVALHPSITGNPLKAPKSVIERVLWDMGMDIKRHRYTTIKQRHRTLRGKAKNGIMFAGVERSDKQWQKSGCNTLAGMIDSVWDLGLKEDLRKISRQ